MGTSRVIQAQHYFAMLSVINRYRTQKFRWGSYDCNTFIADCYDAMFNKSTAEDIKNKYSSRIGAIKFHRDVLGYDAWLTRNGYTKMEDENEPLLGDVIACPSQHYSSCYLFLDGGCVAMTEGGGLGVYDFNALSNKEIWRL